MKTALATVSISGTLEQKFAAAARAGFQGVEIFENDLTQFPGSARDVRLMAADHGLEIIALQPMRDFEAMPEPMRTANFYRMQKKFELMHELGTRRTLMCSNVSPHSVDDNARAAADLHELAELAKAEGFLLAYEALAWGRHVSNYEKSWDIVKRADHPNLGICLDTFHMYSRGATLDCLRNDIPVDKIALVQVADAPYLQMREVLQYSRHYRCFPGQGDFPVVEFMRALKEKGFDDYVSHEIFNDEFRASNPDDKAVDGMRSLIWLDQQSDLPEEHSPEELVDDVEFVEFAVAGESGEELVQVLKQLGFAETHQHKSKQVSLLRQGDINLVLNREPVSQAHQHFENHGVSVCALAFSTPSLKKVMKRADTFRCARFTNQTGPGELNIPAIRGIGDSLIYFVERKPVRFFELDFEPIEGAEAQAETAGLLRIDHIGQTVANTDFLSAAFLYKTLFDFNVEASQDLPDIHGLVVSRTCYNQNKRVRIPINMTNARSAAAQRFINKTHGSGVHQLAFACEDVFAAAERVPAHLHLDIPGNYYRDLEARFQLPAELLARMQSLNILYDRNEDGEFFHFYTREVHGVFCEILQRVGNYDRYGEANAYIRLAAQARAEGNH